MEWQGSWCGETRDEIDCRGAEPKRLKEFQKPDAFKKAFAAQNAVRRIISNDLSLSDYDFLFPSEYHPIRVKREGWDLIRFYLAQAQIQNLPLPESSAMPTTHKKIKLFAGEYFRSRGLSKVKGLLDRLSRGKVGTPWLREIFCRMGNSIQSLNSAIGMNLFVMKTERLCRMRHFSKSGCGWPPFPSRQRARNKSHEHSDTRSGTLVFTATPAF